MCDNEMSFSMMPQLSIVNSRFAKASLRPRCARHRSWRATCRFPNACLGYSPTQWLRWSSSFPNGSKGPSSRLRSSTIRPSLRLVHYSRVDTSGVLQVATFVAQIHPGGSFIGYLGSSDEFISRLLDARNTETARSGSLQLPRLA